MAIKSEIIILRNKRTTVEIKAVDSWLFDLRYLANGRETHAAQIIQPDVSVRVDFLKKEGFVLVPKNEIRLKANL